jgi:hypothetical protein
MAALNWDPATKISNNILNIKILWDVAPYISDKLAAPTMRMVQEHPKTRSVRFWDINAASSGTPSPTFRDNASVLSSRVKKSISTLRNIPEKRSNVLTLEDGTDQLPRNIGKGLPLDAA